MEKGKYFIGLIVAVLILISLVFIGYSMYSIDKSITSLDNEVKEITLNTIEKDIKTVISKTEGLKESINEASEETKNYEYKLVYTYREEDTLESLEKKVNKLGSEGWEYIGYIMNNGSNARVVLLKREKE